MKLSLVKAVLASVLLILVLGSCTTLSVRFPNDMFISSGDYVEGVRTEGILQVHKTVWTPFFVLYDASKVREELYKALIKDAENLVGVDGLTNVTFYSKPSPWSVLMPLTVGIGIWVDHYAEGVAITIE
ncbi:MAG: hypothetical protein KKI09_05810 [Spirochaetes bacterium]|nr:hypothetical protein [Spirochaetota bacterium]MBU0954930.1 hypothetical protein [Spirochaetota bacterium]